MENPYEVFKAEASEKIPQFEYSIENPPPLEILENKIFAVHATPRLPKDGIIMAGAQDITRDKEFNGEEPPSFRPTLHFALGALVKEHDDHSWENTPYAVVSPLKALEGQLVNVFANDTFILGDFDLKNGAILLAPQGTDISNLPDGLRVEFYKPEDGLRMAVDNLIAQEGGWHTEMDFNTGIDSKAAIDGAQINDLRFFKSLFDKYPLVSFGNHLESEQGEAYRFGGVETAVGALMDNFPRSAQEVEFFEAYIKHNLRRLEQFAAESGFNPESLRVLKEKKRKALEWLNIVDCDLETRRKFGKTLLRADEKNANELAKIRNNPKELKKFVDKHRGQLRDAISKPELAPDLAAGLLVNMPPEEIYEFITENKKIFLQMDLNEFYSRYAIKRWLIIKNEQARKDGLDQLLENAIKKLAGDRIINKNKIFNYFVEYLSEDSNRLEIALKILRNKELKKFLKENSGIDFTEDGPFTLKDVYAAHPETKILFDAKYLESEDALKEIGGLWIGAGADISEMSLEPVFRNFEDTIDFADSITHKKFFLDYASRVPLHAVRNVNEILVGQSLTPYERLRRENRDAAKLWQRVGLEDEFKRIFSTDADFWKADKTLLEVYKMLKAEQSDNISN